MSGDVKPIFFFKKAFLADDLVTILAATTERIVLSLSF